jgi:hypothetical protein
VRASAQPAAYRTGAKISRKKTSSQGEDRAELLGGELEAKNNKNVQYNSGTTLPVQFHFPLSRMAEKEINSETKEPNFALMIDTVINYGKVPKKVIFGEEQSSSSFNILQFITSTKRA